VLSLASIPLLCVFLMHIHFWKRPSGKLCTLLLALPYPAARSCWRAPIPAEGVPKSCNSVSPQSGHRAAWRA
jgi:hypothetical protein